MVIGVALTQDDMQRITASVGLAAKVLSESIEDMNDVDEVMRLNILYVCQAGCWHEENVR